MQYFCIITYYNISHFMMHSLFTTFWPSWGHIITNIVDSSIQFRINFAVNHKVVEKKVLHSECIRIFSELKKSYFHQIMRPIDGQNSTFPSQFNFLFCKTRPRRPFKSENRKNRVLYFFLTIVASFYPDTFISFLFSIFLFFHSPHPAHFFLSRNPSGRLSLSPLVARPFLRWIKIPFLPNIKPLWPLISLLLYFFFTSFCSIFAIPLARAPPTFFYFFILFISPMQTLMLARCLLALFTLFLFADTRIHIMPIFFFSLSYFPIKFHYIARINPVVYFRGALFLFSYLYTI